MPELAASWRSGASSAARTTARPAASSPSCPFGIASAALSNVGPAARHDPVGQCGATRLNGVEDAVARLLLFGLRVEADSDERYGARQPGQTDTSLLALVLGLQEGQLGLRLAGARGYRGRLSVSPHDRGVGTGRDHPVRATQLLEPGRFDDLADARTNHLGAGEHRDVAQRVQAIGPEGRRLHRHGREAPLGHVQDEQRERVAGDLVGDDQQRSALLGDRRTAPARAGEPA